MSLIIQRLLDKKKLEEPCPAGLTAEKLVTQIYELIDNGTIHKNAEIHFELAMYTHYMCSNCGYHNAKEYRKTILECEINPQNSNINKLVLWVKRHK